MDHHHVPQFLLRAWADTTQDKKVEVLRLDLPQYPSRRYTPKSTGFEPNLYALTMTVVAGMEQQAVETKFLRHVDSDAAMVRKKMQETGLKSLSSKERADWVRFLMSLRIRQPEIVTMLREDAAKVLRSELDEQPEQYEEIAQDGDAPTLQEWTEERFPGLIENFGLSFFHKLVLDSDIGEKIFRMKWWLWDFKSTERQLLLSDRPCIFMHSLDHNDCVIALPISPYKAFMATRSERVAAIMRAIDPKHLVMRLNESSISQSRVRIYSRDNSSRRFILNRLRIPLSG